MRAIVIKRYGGPEVLAIEERPEPAAEPGHVVVEVKAFGLNHAEIYFRKGAWGDVAEISGIECVGRVKADPDHRFKPGQTVLALVGGMGRSINGSYAELVTVPSSNVVAVDSDLPWEDLAAIPESYATAWTSLIGILALAKDQVVAIRGATSALGQAAVNIAAGTHLSVFASAVVTGTPAFPLSEIPFQTIVSRVAEGSYKAKPARVFSFSEIRDAHRLMEANEAGGKIVVRV